MIKVKNLQMRLVCVIQVSPMQSYGSLKEAEKGRRVGLRDVRRIQQLFRDFEDGKKT